MTGLPSKTRLAPRERAILIALLLGALLVRLAVMWMPGDQMFENGNLPYEELVRGNAAQDMLRGTLLPLFDYQLNVFSGGSLFVSMLAAPLFAVLGPTLNVLRLVSLVFSIPLVLLVFLLVRRKCSLRSAVVAAALCAFGPPGFLFISCTVFGAHPEQTAISVLLAWLWFSWNDAGREGKGLSFLLGLAIGFGLWFSYGLCLIVGILLLQNLATTRLRGPRASDLLLGLGFVIGFAPWVVNALTHDGSAFQIYDASIADHLHSGLQQGGTLGKAAHLLAKDGPDAFWMHGAWEGGGLAVARILLGAFCVVILWCAWSSRAELRGFLRALFLRQPGYQASLRVVALCFVFAWFGAYVLTDFEVDWYVWVQGYRYLVPFWPFMAIVIGIAVEDLARRGRVLVPAFAVALVCVTHTTFTLVQCRPARWTEQWAAPGTKHLWHLRTIVLRFGWDEKTMGHVLRRAIETREPAERTALVEAVAGGIAKYAVEPALDPKWAARQPGFQRTLAALADSGPEEFRPIFQKARADALARQRTR